MDLQEQRISTRKAPSWKEEIKQELYYDVLSAAEKKALLTFFNEKQIERLDFNNGVTNG